MKRIRSSTGSSKGAESSKRTIGPNRSRRSNLGYTITEFGAAFYAFCIVIVLPTVSFVNLAVAFTYGFISSSLMADKVSQALNIDRAEQILSSSASSLRCDPVAQLIKIAPSDESFKLDIVKSNAKGETTLVRNGITGSSIRIGGSNRVPASSNSVPTSSNSGPASSNSKGILQFRITANYSTKPLIDLTSVPLINQIPIIGKETNFCFRHLRIPEHLE